MLILVKYQALYVIVNFFSEPKPGLPSRVMRSEARNASTRALSRLRALPIPILAALTAAACKCWVAAEFMLVGNPVWV